MSKTIRNGDSVRNPVAIAMSKRYGKTTSVMKDRRSPRGGTKNYQADFLAELEEDRSIQEEVESLEA